MPEKFSAYVAAFLLISFFMLPLDHSLLSTLPERSFPLWWEIEIILEAEGEYNLKQIETSYSGHYSFTILWTGSMEKDDSDYILYYEESRLLNWKAEEREGSSEHSRIKTGQDFQEKPSFHLNYVLRKEKNLHFYFSVDGISVPQSKSCDKIYLYLPCSGENSEFRPEIDYDSFVIEGSNQIFFEEEEIYTNPVKREFSWQWKHYQWSLNKKNPAFLTNIHKAKVKISISPHYE